MGTANTVRRDKSLPGNRKVKKGKIAEIQPDSGKKEERDFFFNFPLKW